MTDDRQLPNSCTSADVVFSRRKVVFATLSLPAASFAQISPAQKWVVPFPPGGAIDVLSRLVAQDVHRLLGVPIVIENRPGAGGNIGVEQVLRAPTDGATFLVAGFGLATNSSLFPKLSFDVQRDLTPVSMLGSSPMFLVAGPSEQQVTSFQSLIELGKSRKSLTFGHAGTGTSTHLAVELLSSMAGIGIQTIPYKGSSPAINDLLGGQVGFVIDSPTVLLSHIRAGKVKALAVTTRARSALLPDVPTIAEFGVRDYEVAPWYGVFAHRGAPVQPVSKLQEAIASAASSPVLKEKCLQLGVDLHSSSQAELQQHLRLETEKWSRLIRARGIKAE